MVKRASVRRWPWSVISLACAIAPTPFGLFASHGMGRTGATTCLEVPPLDQCVRRSRIDMGYLHELARRGAERTMGCAGTLLYRPNTSLYRLGGRVRLAEAVPGGRGPNLQPGPPWRRMRACETSWPPPRAGATIDRLAGALVEFQGVEPEAARAYIHDLIDLQGAGFRPRARIVRAGTPTQELMVRMAGAEETRGLAQALGQAREILSAMDARGPSGPARSLCETGRGSSGTCRPRWTAAGWSRWDLFRSSAKLSLGAPRPRPPFLRPCRSWSG